jgi:DNA-binding transcriptional MerR regulator
MTVLFKQLLKVKTHYKALKEYKEFIDNMQFDFSKENFVDLETQQKAVLDAYLKRFASLQDYLGAKVFKSLLDTAGITYTKMSEVLTLIEKEDIISLDRWIEFRNVRNELEHDYPDVLEEALNDLKYCVDNFYYIEEMVKKVFEFARKYDENIKLY